MEPFPNNRPLKARRRLVLLGVGVATYLCSVVLAQFPQFTECVYANGIGPPVARLLASVTGIVPVSIAELALVAFIARQLVPAGRALWHTFHDKTREPRNVFLAGALRFGQDVGVLLTLFYVLWGFNYSRTPLATQLGWDPVGETTVDELADLSEQLVMAANGAYLEIHGTEDTGANTPQPEDPRGVEAAILDGWANARRNLGLPDVSGRYGRVKRLVATRLYEVFGVVGFYFPFTGEANVRRGVPASEWPQSIAHEKAHQRGVARESEANFWGYLSAANAPEPHARYSAYLFAQYQLLSALTRSDPARRRAITALRLPGVQRDVDSARAYWLRLRGPGTEVGRVVNNAFLRSNRVPGGVRSYSRSAAFIIAYARTRGGQLGVAR